MNAHHPPGYSIDSRGVATLRGRHQDRKAPMVVADVRALLDQQLHHGSGAGDSDGDQQRGAARVGPGIDVRPSV